jgi:hypothetical protein
MKSCKIQRPGDEQEVRQVCSDGLETNALIIQLFRRIPIWIRAGYLVREVLRAETCRLHPLGVPAGEQYGTEDLHVLHQIKLLLPLTVYTPLPNTLQTPHTCACSQSSALSRISPIPSFLPSFLPPCLTQIVGQAQHASPLEKSVERELSRVMVPGHGLHQRAHK